MTNINAAGVLRLHRKCRVEVRVARLLDCLFSVMLVLALLGACLPVLAEPTVLTPETVALKSWLAREGEGFALGGHWSAGSASIGWALQEEVSGRQPLLFSVEYYDDGPIERKSKERAQAAAYMLEKFRAGGIVTLVDHMPNFVTRGDAWDTQGDTFAAILPGGWAHEAYRAYLDRFALYVSELRAEGVKVPILYRPFHEMNGNWFWWGSKVKFGHGLVDLWRFTHDYLVMEKGVDNLLWVWAPNTDQQPSGAVFESYWPGKAYVDVVGLDGYDNTPSPNFESTAFARSFQIVSNLAYRNHLPVAWTEIGFKPGGQSLPGFWSGKVLPALKGQYKYVRYVLIWNADLGPKKGTPAAESFVSFSADPAVLRLGDVGGDAIYGPGYPKKNHQP